MAKKKRTTKAKPDFRQQCIEAGLPYFTEKGEFRNMHHFKEAGDTFEKNGAYTDYPRGSKGYMDFWVREKDRVLNGCRIGDIWIPGEWYFFLNYHPMDIPKDSDASSSEVYEGFAKLMRIHYDASILLHYARKHGLNLVFIKPRSSGMSEFFASCGARDYAVISEDANGRPRFYKSIYFAYEENTLTEDGILSKCFKTIDHLNKHTAFDHAFITMHPSHRKAGYKDKKGNPTQTGGEVIGQVVNKPDKVRGKRGHTIYWEESGANPHLSKAWKTGLDLSRRAGVVTGLHVAWGTSNGDPKGVDAFKKILLNPKPNFCVRFRNIWEENGEPIADPESIPLNVLDLIIPHESDEQGVGWFVPAYCSDLRFMDKDGNPLRREAYDYYMKMRKDLHNEAAMMGEVDTDIALYTADHPMTMSEALFKKGNNPFDTKKLAKQYQDLTMLKKYPSVITGELEWVFSYGSNIPTGVKFVRNNSGKVVLIEEPLKNDVGQKYENLYVGGIDSIDIGVDNSQVGTKGSQFCIIIHKRLFGTGGNYPVAYYMDRPGNETEAYSNAAKMLMFYGCQANVEATKTTIITYFREKGWGKYLYQQPSIARLEGAPKQNNRVGTPAHEKYVLHGLELIKRYIDEFYNCLYLPELVSQLLSYDYAKKGDFDMVAAFAMCMIADEDMMNVVQKTDLKPKPYRIGYYIDSSGKKRYGKVPEKILIQQGIIDLSDEYLDGKTNRIVKT